MRSVRRAGKALAVALAAVAAVGIMLLRTVANDSLIRRSTRLTTLPAGWPSGWPWTTTGCFWSSDGGLLLVHKGGGPSAAFIWRDARTGKERALRALDALFIGSGGATDSCLDLSPDGKRLLWTTETWSSTPQQPKPVPHAWAHIANLDGSGHRKLPMGPTVSLGEARVLWLGNGRWLTCRMRTPEGASPGACSNRGYDCPDVRVFQQGADNTGTDVAEVAGHPGALEIWPPNTVSPAPDRLRYGQFVAPGCVRVIDWACEPKLRLLNAQDIRGPARNLRAWSLSPRGDRIAWLVLPNFSTGLVGWMNRTLPGRVSGMRLPSMLWVSRVDGTGMRLVGREPFLDSADIPDHIEWLPDEKHLSFTLKDILYTVPAD